MLKFAFVLSMSIAMVHAMDWENIPDENKTAFFLTKANWEFKNGLYDNALQTLVSVPIETDDSLMMRINVYEKLLQCVSKKSENYLHNLKILTVEHRFAIIKAFQNFSDQGKERLDYKDSVQNYIDNNPEVLQTLLYQYD